MIATVVFDLVGIALLGGYFLYFLRQQNFGVGRSCFSTQMWCQNKFLAVTIAMVLIDWFGAILQLSGKLSLAGLASMDKTTYTVLVSLGNCCNILAIAGHVFLLKSRSAVILESTPRLVQVVHWLAGAFCIFGIGFLLSTLAVAFSGVNAGLVWLAQSCFGGLYGLTMSMIDVISTIAFYKHVRASRMSLGSQKHVNMTVASDVIASVGTYSCLFSLIGAFLFAIAQGIQSGNRLASEWIYVFIGYAMLAVSISWMRMKIILNELSRKQTKESVRPISTGRLSMETTQS
jgi:hypothetical protein